LPQTLYDGYGNPIIAYTIAELDSLLADRDLKIAALKTELSKAIKLAAKKPSRNSKK